MAHSLIQIQSYLFIISQPKVIFQFLIFKEIPTSTYHYFHPVSHFNIANGIAYKINAVPCIAYGIWRYKQQYTKKY